MGGGGGGAAVQVSKTMAAVMEELQARSDSMADEVFESMDANKVRAATRVACFIAGSSRGRFRGFWFGPDSRYRCIRL